MQIKTFTEPEGYEAISKDVIANLPSYIHKTPEEIKNIVIVGACNGLEIDTFIDLYKYVKIIAIEPSPKTFDFIKNKYAGNDKVFCFNVACSDFSGVAKLYELSMPGNGSLLKVSEKSVYNLKETEVIDVDVTILDTILHDIVIDLLMIDVQGSELSVLKGYSNINNALSLFLEVSTGQTNHKGYEGECNQKELENYLTGHTLHSIGMDNELNNGTGNAFWIRNDLI